MPDEEEGIERRALTLSYHLASNSSGKRLASERSLDVKRSVKTEGNSESNHQREGRGNMSSMSQRKGKKTRSSRTGPSFQQYSKLQATSHADGSSAPKQGEPE